MHFHYIYCFALMSCFEKVSAVIVFGVASYYIYKWWTQPEPDPKDYERADAIKPTPQPVQPTQTIRRRRRPVNHDDLMAELEKTKHMLGEAELANYMRKNAKKLQG